MSTISFRLSEEESELIHRYASINGLNLSDFIRRTVLDRIEDDMVMNHKVAEDIESSLADMREGRAFRIDEARKELKDGCSR